MAVSRVSVNVPATTANLGPGFDCLGMALSLWNGVRLERTPQAAIQVFGEGEERLSRGEDNLVYRAVASLFRKAGQEVPPLRLLCRNRIPLGRGLGSSAAAVVGGLVAANLLLEEPLSRDKLLTLAVKLEGHPDNVAPALLGGVQVVVRSGEEVVTSSVSMPPGLKAVVFIPERSLSTEEARRVLPREVSLEDAVRNIGRAALLVNALAQGKWELLRIATEDRLHQPYREKLIPEMRLLFRTALQAGALGVFLSGAGSSVLALTRDRALTIAYEMANVADKKGVPGTVKVLEPTATGAHAVEVE